MSKEPTSPKCHSDRDGECAWQECPQLRDGEPEKSGRYCPYAAAWDAYFIAEYGDRDGRS